jgi:hypothetical protein
LSTRLHSALRGQGYEIYAQSIRSIGSDSTLLVVQRNGRKLVALVEGTELPDMGEPVAGVDTEDGSRRALIYELTWECYRQLATLLPILPSPCNSKASFGTGDRLGMVTAAHLEADKGYPVFPVIAQQSPRELERTGRSFRSVLLDAVMGVLESGWTGTWGADADHIKDEARLLEGIEAGYTMYTLDVSDELQSIDGLSAAEIAARAESLSDSSKRIVRDWSGGELGGHEFSTDELSKSAVIYEKSMERVVRFDAIAGEKLSAYDLEVSIDEGARDTTPEDHLFAAEYLHRAGVDFKSLAPKFPGEFQKAVDYIGDLQALRRSFDIHAKISQQLKGYRLSLHSGSDKFSVYKMFSEATEGNFHIKTSGTSWLQAVNLIAHENAKLFGELYAICLATLPESKKAYHVYITPEHFPAQPSESLPEFFAIPDVQQLFHISYGALLDARRDDIVRTLSANEPKHYGLVSRHIDRHMELLFG